MTILTLFIGDRDISHFSVKSIDYVVSSIKENTNFIFDNLAELYLVLDGQEGAFALQSNRTTDYLFTPREMTPCRDRDKPVVEGIHLFTQSEYLDNFHKENGGVLMTIWEDGDTEGLKHYRIVANNMILDLIAFDIEIIIFETPNKKSYYKY